MTPYLLKSRQTLRYLRYFKLQNRKIIYDINEINTVRIKYYNYFN